jgi:hypothetical protein
VGAEERHDRIQRFGHRLTAPGEEFGAGLDPRQIGGAFRDDLADDDASVAEFVQHHPVTPAEILEEDVGIEGHPDMGVGNRQGEIVQCSIEVLGCAGIGEAR